MDPSSTVPTSHAAILESPPLVGTVVVRVIEGPDLGKSVILHDAQPTRLLVGRSPSCALNLTDPAVSRRHLAFELVEGHVRVTDLESLNGTQVDHLSIVEVTTRGGEIIRLGGTKLVVERGEQTTTRPLSTRTSFGSIVGQSREMRRLYPLCERLAASKVPLLIEGETGTGKEVLAESIHQESPRRAKPFLVFDCTAVAPTLVESELFGHERGAFTGATQTRLGVFEQADGGTLLIDEIGDLDASLQPKLLRALERFEFRRVGGTKSIRVDVRILTATRRDLDKEVQAGRFRDDLFHRLAVSRIELPPLRRRRGDIRHLVTAFCAHLGGDPAAIDETLLAKWEQYAWPGNVRELRNAVARRLELGDLADWESEGPPSLRQGAPTENADQVLASAIDRILALDLPIITARKRMIEEFERRYLERVLAANGGVVSRAAEASGIARRHFHRLLARSGLRD